MTTIFNVTQHTPTAEQIAEGVYNTIEQWYVSELLTFEDIPARDDMWDRAMKLADVVWASADELGIEEPIAMIGGAPFFMYSLELVFTHRKIKTVYAFSKRESVEEHAEDGSVIKRNVFKHAGFVGL